MKVAGPAVVISFALRDVPRLDFFSKSDPFCVISRLENGRKIHVETTEVVMNNEDPIFQKKLTATFSFEEEQLYCVDVYDLDEGEMHELHKHDYLGSCQFNLAKLLSADGGTLHIQLLDKAGKPVHKKASSPTDKNKSLLVLNSTQLEVSPYKFYIRCSGVKYTKTSLFGKDDSTFIEFCRETENGSLIAAYESNIVKENQNPCYSNSKIDVANLTDTRDISGNFVVRAVAVNDDGKRTIIGQNHVNLKGFCKVPVPSGSGKQTLLSCEGATLRLFDAKKKESGSIIFHSGHIKLEHSFLDYLQGGIDFNLSMAIDLSARNGPLGDIKGLHYLHPSVNGPVNQYIDAIRSVGNILASYCRKQYIPVFAFGAAAAIDGGEPQHSDCFPLSLQSQQPFASGAEDAVKLYINALPHIVPSTEANLAPVIQAVTRAAQQRPYSADYQHFNILLLITQGSIDDFDATVESIIDASEHPISIIIVGVGQNDFSQCEVLDADYARLQSKITGKYAHHDMVQFCSFLTVMGDANVLAKQVLAEVPEHLTNFMELHNVSPLPNRRH